MLRGIVPTIYGWYTGVATEGVGLTGETTGAGGGRQFRDGGGGWVLALHSLGEG